MTIKWNGVTDQLYLNNVLVQSFSYSPVVPNWTAASNLDVGAYEYLTYGGYYVSDDIIDEFTVMTLPSNQPPPSVTITSPPNGAAVNGTVTVAANAASAAGIAGVQFKLDGANLGPAVIGAGPSYSTSWDTTSASNGAHLLSAVATDVNGLTATSSNLSVTVNNTLNPPVISNVLVSSITSNAATISWTTGQPANSQVAYGATNAYGSLSNLNPALVTSHSVTLSALLPSTIYHFQAQSTDAGGLGVSADSTFTTAASGTVPPALLLHMDATEVSGTTNGSLITPSTGPAGYTGNVVNNGGSVNYVPAQVGNGAYFMSCCQNSGKAYYKFTGTQVGNIFNVSQGQISFNLTSRYSFNNRVANAPQPRYVFDVRDGNTANHLFYFKTEIAMSQGEPYLLFTWRVGNGSVAGYTSYFYWVDQSVADTLFGSGVALNVTMKWNGVTDQLYLNNVLVQSFSYTPIVPSWTAASNLDVGAYEYLTYGGFSTCDDIIDEFEVFAQ